ncbi:conserved Plasmodium protein, unknown function [Plasmodium sp. DRC-Itaito]|nr:conserved Plasmodium protein, unknown function [Plasmodium sp. DRC-Itaito]
MLNNNAKKIQLLKKILYRENIKNKQKNNFRRVFKDYINNEKITFLYNKNIFIQIIEFNNKQKSLYLNSDVLKNNKNGNDQLIIKKEENLNCFVCDKENKHLGEKKNKINKFNIKNVYPDNNKNIYDDANIYNHNQHDISIDTPYKNSHTHECIKIKNYVINKQIIDKKIKEQNGNNTCHNRPCDNMKPSTYCIEENNYLNLNPVMIKKKKKNVEIVDKYINKWEKHENKKNKLIIKYEIKNIADIINILNKCKEYNYVNNNLYDDIINNIINTKDNYYMSLKNLLLISNSFIKLNYFNETFYNYIFIHILKLCVISTQDLISILYIMSNIKKLNMYNYIFLYKMNFMFLHRLYSLSIYQLYKVLSCYLKIYKTIDKLKKRKNEDSSNNNTIHNKEKKYLSDNKEHILKKYNKINSQQFHIFYKINFEQIVKNEKNNNIKINNESIDLVFFLIEHLTDKKIKINHFDTLLDISDPLNDLFFSYFKKKMASFFLKKVHSEYITFNKEQRKFLYKKRDAIVQMYKKEQLKKKNDISKGGVSIGDISKGGVSIGDISKGGMSINDISKGGVSINDISFKQQKNNYINITNNQGCIKNSEKILLKIISKMKRKIKSRIFIPFIKIYEEKNLNKIKNKSKDIIKERDTNKLLYSFFCNSYKNMNLTFDPKSLLITLSCFSKKRQLLFNDVIYMLTYLIEKKINYYNHEQIIDLMNSYSNMKNEKISNNIFNFLARFLFNNNKIIYLNDTHIHILLNILIKKKCFINQDVIKYISNFVMYHKPYYKNLKNASLYLFFHYHFNSLNENFLNNIFCTLHIKNMITLYQCNQVLSSTLVIGSNKLKYQKRVYNILDTSILNHLKEIYSNKHVNISLNDVKNIVDFVFYFNNSITGNVLKAEYQNIKVSNDEKKKNNKIKNHIIQMKEKIYNNNNDNYDSISDYNYDMSIYTPFISPKKSSNKKKPIYFYSFNSFDKIYLMNFSFNIRIFILIKQIVEYLLKETYYFNNNNNNNTFIILMVKLLCNVYEIVKKINSLNNNYTYLYINNKSNVKKNKIINNYFLRTLNNMNNNILFFVSKGNERIIFLSNYYMLKNRYFFEHINYHKIIRTYIEYQIDKVRNNDTDISSILILFDFLSSYKIDEIMLLAPCIKMKGQNESSHLDEKRDLEEMHMNLMTNFLYIQKLRGREEKMKNEITSIMYNEKKKKKKSSIKNVMKIFFVTLQLRKFEYISNMFKNKYEKLYMSKVLFNNIEKRMIKRKIENIDAKLKLNNSFRHINKYNKYVMNKFCKKWKKRKKYLILKCTHISQYIDTNNLIDLLYYTLTLTIRHYMNKICSQNNRIKNINSFIIYEKFIIFILNKMVLLKKPQIMNINYYLYYKMNLCIYTLKYLHAKLYKSYKYILMYWKFVILRILQRNKTFKNYMDSIHFNNNNRTSNNAIQNIEKNEINKFNSTYMYLLNYPSISQTSYKYKLQNDTNKNILQNNLHYKNTQFYKNIVHHNLYQQFSYLQNASHKLYMYFIYFQKKLKGRNIPIIFNGKYIKKETKRRKKSRIKRMNLINSIKLNKTSFLYNDANHKETKKNKNKNILLKNNIEILEMKKIYILDNHLIQVHIKNKSKSTNINMNTNENNIYVFYIYSSNNINEPIPNHTHSKKEGIQKCNYYNYTKELLRQHKKNDKGNYFLEQKREGSIIYMKRDTLLNLYIIQHELHKQLMSPFHLIPVCSEELNKIKNRKNLYVYLTKLFV